MAIVAALAGAGGYGDARPSPSEPPRLLAHGASISSDNPLQAVVRVSLSRPARVFVEYGNPLAGEFRSAPSAIAAEHDVPLARLREETTYRYAIGIDDDARPEGAGGAQFTTGALPPRLDILRGRAGGGSTHSLLLESLTAYRLEAGESSLALLLLVRDASGEIVWYYDRTVRPTGREPPWQITMHAVRQLPSGNFLFMYRGCCLVEITPLGLEVGAIMNGDVYGRFHHDFLLLGDDRLLYLHRDGVAIHNREGNRFRDQLRILRRSAGSVETVWDAREVWNLSFADGYRGTQVNGVSASPGGGFLVSSRTRDQVASLTADFRAVQWRLGGEDGDFAFPDPNDRFYGQHTAAELASGNVLLFDNGDGRPQAEGGAYSRALELRLDRDKMQATKVWEHRGQFARYASSAFRLANGNTLVNYGWYDRNDRNQPADGRFSIALFEVCPAGNEVFEIRHAKVGDAGEGVSRYRAQPIFSINGETMLRAPTPYDVGR